MFVSFLVVTSITTNVELGYNFPLDEGMNKIMAGILILFTAIWTSFGNYRNAMFMWVLAGCLYALLFGGATAVAFIVISVVTRFWVRHDADIKNMIKRPLEPEE